MNKVKVITKLPNEKAKIEEIPNDFDFVSEFVEGLVDSTFLPTDEDIDVIVNDSSLTLGMEPNIVTPEYEGVLAGPLIFCTHDEEGEMVSLSDEQIEKAMKYIERNSVFNMSLERAYQYSQIIGPLQRCEDELGMEA